MFLNNGNKIYNLQQLKEELLKLELEKKDKIVINEFNLMKGNIYGIFSTDNSFLFAKEKSCLESNYSLSVFSMLRYMFKIVWGGAPLFSKNYYLIDFFSRIAISDEYDETFIDGDIYEENSIEYYVITLSKIIPASILKNISLENVRMIQDAINIFLANNPDFINQVIFKNEAIEQSEIKSVKLKKLIPPKNLENK